jgi:hypothetical protein
MNPCTVSNRIHALYNLNMDTGGKLDQFHGAGRVFSTGARESQSLLEKDLVSGAGLLSLLLKCRIQEGFHISSWDRAGSVQLLPHDCAGSVQLPPSTSSSGLKGEMRVSCCASLLGLFSVISTGIAHQGYCVIHPCFDPYRPVDHTYIQVHMHIFV